MRLLAASPVGKQAWGVWTLEDSWLDRPGLQNAVGEGEIKQVIRKYIQLIEGWRERESVENKTDEEYASGFE